MEESHQQNFEIDSEDRTQNESNYTIENKEHPVELDQKPTTKKGKIGGGLSKLLEEKETEYRVFLEKVLEDGSRMSITVSIKDSFKIIDLLIYSLEVYNDKLYNENYDFALDSDIQKWAICSASKKNGRSKDEPNFAQEILVKDTGAQLFSLLPQQQYSTEAFIYKNQQINKQEQIQETQSTEQDQEEQKQQQQQQNQQQLQQNQQQSYQNDSKTKKYSDDVIKIPNNQPKKQPKKDVQDDSGCFSCFK